MNFDLWLEICKSSGEEINLLEGSDGSGLWWTWRPRMIPGITLFEDQAYYVFINNEQRLASPNYKTAVQYWMAHKKEAETCHVS